MNRTLTLVRTAALGGFTAAAVLVGTLLAGQHEASAASVPHEPLLWTAVNMPQATGSTLAVAGEPAEQQDSKGNEIIVRGRVTGWF